MPPLRFRVQLDRTHRRRLLAAVLLLHLAFTVTTGLFMLLWARIDALAPSARWFVRYILVQGHLATENVAAVWYASMLLLGVAALAALAWAADRRAGAGPLRHGWLAFAGLFTVLSMDELGSLHERIGMIPLRDGPPMGWVYLLAGPILLVAAFMTMFAVLHLRRISRALQLVVAGVLLFLLNPVVEELEMAMIRGGPGGESLSLRYARLVIEEVGIELTGVLCFAAAACLSLVRTAGGTSDWQPRTRAVRWASRLAIAGLVAGALGSGWINAALPEGDTGVLQNWFPAAAWVLVAGVAATRADLDRRTAVAVAAGGVALSMVFGIGLYFYVDWLASRASWFVPVCAVLTAGLTLEAVLSPYLFRRSPMSSTASPTLRRPRPNPS